MGNFDNKGVSRQVDLAPIYDYATDRSSHILAEILRQLQGARMSLTELGTGAKQIIANRSMEPALVVGSKKGPFLITNGSTDQVIVEFNNSGTDITVDMTATTGTYTAAEVAAFLNNDATFAAKGEAFATYDEKVAIKSKEAGITSQIEIKSATANTPLGFTVATTQGDAKQWDTARGTLATSIGTAVKDALTLVKLAANTKGNTQKEDLSKGLPIK